MTATNADRPSSPANCRSTIGTRSSPIPSSPAPSSIASSTTLTASHARETACARSIPSVPNLKRPTKPQSISHANNEPWPPSFGTRGRVQSEFLAAIVGTPETKNSGLCGGEAESRRRMGANERVNEIGYDQRGGIYMKSRLFDVDRSTAMIARILPSARLALAGILVLLPALPAESLPPPPSCDHVPVALAQDSRARRSPLDDNVAHRPVRTVLRPRGRRGILPGA